MLVERVFLVSGVVKTLFSPKKKIRDFFLFLPRTKKSKADFVGISKSPLFATETHRIFWNFVEFFFNSVKNFCIEHVLFSFLFGGRKFYAGYDL
jgi:hypothetical protein